jgi:hypothetical protein
MVNTFRVTGENLRFAASITGLEEIPQTLPQK